MSTMTLNIPAPRRAEKRKVKLKMAVQGPSGSGKTWGALALAKNLWPDARVCVVDTENGSSELYADRFEFDTIPLAPPFHTDRYIACMESAVKLGYDVLIIDQISHQWDGDGGILRRKEELDRRPGSNSFTNWSAFTPEHEKFKQAIVQAPIHLIATMRSKQDHIMVTNDKGKQTPQKVGLAPIQREGFDYEFTLVFDVQMDHKATVGKDRTALFSDQIVDLASPKIADQLRAWMDNGAAAPIQPVLVQQTQQPVSDKPFRYESPNLICAPLNVEVRETKTKAKFRVVKLNGECEGKRVASCFHVSLFDALDMSVGENCQFEVRLENGYLTILDVISIGSRDFRDGKPYSEVEAKLVITDDDIPF
jgi:hypothetical protein